MQAGNREIHVGDTQTWERVFSAEEVQLFAQLSGDQGVHHVTPDEQGRLMVHGLLTATLPTKIGGELNYIAREMAYEFIRPVYVGDTVQCQVTITHLEQLVGRIAMSAVWVCRNQQGKEVLTGRTSGIIRTV